MLLHVNTTLLKDVVHVLQQEVPPARMTLQRLPNRSVISLIGCAGGSFLTGGSRARLACKHQRSHFAARHSIFRPLWHRPKACVRFWHVDLATFVSFRLPLEWELLSHLVVGRQVMNSEVSSTSMVESFKPGTIAAAADGSQSNLEEVKIEL